MKKIIYFILFLISIPSFSTTFLDYFYRIDGYYTNAKFIDQNKVVLVGSSGKVLFSLDNGTNWYSNYANTKETLIACDLEPNTKNLFCVGSNGTIIKTTNLGKSWEKVSINSNWDLYSISFSKNIGLIATDDGFIFKSTDYGTNWTKLTSVSSFSFKLVKILKDGSIIAIDKNCGIYISKDNGDNWLTINSNYELVSALCGGLCISNDLMAIYTSKGLLISNDNGKTWVFKEILGKVIIGLNITNKYQVCAVCKMPNDGSLYRYFDMYDINFENDVKITKVENSLDKNYLLYTSIPMGITFNEYSKVHESLVYGSFNSIMMSFDGLNTWQAKSYFCSNSYPTLFAFNSDTLFAGTDRNNIFHSFNGGATWLPQKDSSYMITPYSINSLYFSDGMNGIALPSNANTKMSTKDGGINFDTFKLNNVTSQYNYIQNSNIYCLTSFESNNKGQFCRVYLTSDGGKNFNYSYWYSHIVSSFNFLENGKIISLATNNDTLDPITNKKLYLTYYLSTEDYGATWNWELIKNLNRPYGLAIINDSLAFIRTAYSDSVSAHYTLYKSIDNLNTWKIVLETTVNIGYQKDFKKGIGLLIGSQGEIYQTKDFGDSWQQLTDSIVINSYTGLLHTTDKSIFLTASKSLYRSIPDSFNIFTKVNDRTESTELTPPPIWLYPPFPNPVTTTLSFEMIWIKSINENKIKLEIYDLEGNRLCDISNSPRNYLLDNKVNISYDVEFLKSGVYYLCASTIDYKRTISFVVVR